MSQELISYIPSIVTLVALMALIAINNPKKAQNQSAIFLMAALAGWLAALFVADTSINSVFALGALRVALIFTNLILLALMYFALKFPYEIRLKSIKIKIFFVAPLVLLSLFSFSSSMIESVGIDQGAYIESSGLLYTLQLSAIAIYGLGAFGLLFSKLKHSSASQKAQLKLIIASGVLAIVINIVANSAFVTMGLTEYTALVNSVSIIIVSLSLAYAIVRHRLFDIRLIVARTLAYALLVLTLGLTYGYLVFGFVDQFFPGTQTTILQQAIYTLLAVFLAFTFQPMKRFFDQVTDRIFYRDSYDSENVLKRLGKVFVNKGNSFGLLDDSLSIITEALRVEFGRLVVMDKKRIYKTAHTGAYPDAKVIATDLSKFKQQINILDEIQNSKQEEVLRSLKAYTLVRLTTQDGLVGYLILGNKQSGTIYTQQDVNLLEILSQELAVAIQNAKSYEEIQAFSETLKQEVEEATAQLRETNKRLVKLDQAKDEFISMASHQLRTPLTTVKGYLSMLLEGDAGKLTKKQEEFIDTVFISSERMVHLIADMLNVSRISTGRLTIDENKFDLGEIAGSELEQLHRQAESRDVKLKFHKPDEPIMVKLDETKIRQVIMNFTDNAIYYTPGGKVDVYVEKKGNMAEFRVKDNGIGVSKDAQRQLFSKFFRADNAQSVRPDGTGLGLYMAKQVIEAQKGEIIFESKEGKGSTFGFRFKLEK